MSANGPPDLDHLVPGRDCGTCNACCIWLTIDDPELRKVQGHRCANLRPDSACAVYPTRPRTCRDYYCGFRRLDWVPATLRPDLSSVLIGLQYDGPPSNPDRRLGVSFSVLGDDALGVDCLAETVAAAVAAELPVWLHVPGPPGHTAASARIDAVLREPVRMGDLQTVLRILQLAHARGKQGDFEPVVFDDDRR
jgi:hypothetical protein